MHAGTSTNQRVEVLWADSNPIGLEKNDLKLVKSLRVAAYCRVSTELEEQNESFEMQERHYTRLIMDTPGWRLAGIYADYGISGTQRLHRTGFQRMMRHCKEGKIDRIISKSISRFARNTMDLLDSVRELKELGISVVFEKEGIDTMAVQSEFILSTIAAIAQEESRSISENMTWAFRKRFQQGVPVFRRILGYDVSGRGKDRVISINGPEARIVREIYGEFLDGKGYTEIARLMMSRGNSNLGGRSEWTMDTVKGILTNERYKGDVLCQKTYTEDYLSHKTIRNKGEKKQYYIRNHHQAIIDRDVFDRVQNTIESSKANSKSRQRIVYPLSGRISCGVCGANYHRYNASSYARWVCSRRNKDKRLCSSESVSESDLEKVMLKALDLRYDFTDDFFMHRMKLDIRRIQDFDDIERKRVVLKREIREAMSQSLKAKGEELKVLEASKADLEKRLVDLEAYWKLLEMDREKRIAALEWMEALPRNGHKQDAFLKELNVEHMRAWVMGVKILSPISFAIEWFDNSTTQVEL